MLSKCDFIIGPSSGPMHLANLCEVPAYWWSANEKEQARYKKVWNPFKCENVCVSRTWKPTVEEVIECISS